MGASLQLAQCLFSLMAALFWLISSKFGSFPFMDIPMDELDKKLQNQARYSAIAAGCAAIAAILQVPISFN